MSTLNFELAALNSTKQENLNDDLNDEYVQFLKKQKIKKHKIKLKLKKKTPKKIVCGCWREFTGFDAHETG